MKLIFKHLLQRQRKNGPEDTFRFKSIKYKGKTITSKYQNNLNEDSDSENNPDHQPTTRSTRGIHVVVDGPVTGHGTTSESGPTGRNGPANGPTLDIGLGPGPNTPSPTPSPISNTDPAVEGDSSLTTTDTLRNRPRPRPRPKQKK